jgi:hypothetical protein
MKTIMTQYGIPSDFCYADSDELSLICPECGINSVRISPPQITYEDPDFRGMVVTIRCECENFHTFSVVFGQHEGITLIRTSVNRCELSDTSPDQRKREQPDFISTTNIE